MFGHSAAPGRQPMLNLSEGRRQQCSLETKARPGSVEASERPLCLIVSTDKLCFYPALSREKLPSVASQDHDELKNGVFLNTGFCSASFIACLQEK